MRERPILMSGPMVRAILAGTKTQTRRPVKNMPPMPMANCHPQQKQRHDVPYFDAYCGQSKTEANPRGMSEEWCWWQVDDRQCLPTIRCPFGQPGDRLWVRETFKHLGGAHIYHGERYNCVRYHADGLEQRIDEPEGEAHNLTLHYLINTVPSIHMPRWACRLVLEIVSVRVERVFDITEEDAQAEGFVASAGFLAVFGQIYGLKGQTNPWVWVVEFKRTEASA